MADTPEMYEMPMVSLWAVHSSREERPVLRGWAKSEGDAESLVANLKLKDEQPEDEYWVEQMTAHDFKIYQSMGIIPAELKV